VTGRFNLSADRLALLESMLRAEGVDRTPTRTVPHRPDPAAPVPLTFSQSRYWFLENFAARASAYVISAAMRVHGDFRLDVFARACHEIVRRHESLRTVFFELDGRPVQQVRDDLRPDVRIVDLSGTDPAAIDAEVARREAELVHSPFDLTAGPLLRVELLDFGAGESAVLLNVHHMVSDRWSMGVLMGELTRLYGALSTGRADDLPELPVQYADFALWQQEHSGDAAWRADLDYWLRQLHGVPAELGLPTDHERPREKSYRGSSVPVELPPPLVARLRELAKAEGATLFMVLTAAFKALVSRLSGTEDVVVGTPVAGRTAVELEPLIGLFVNTLALRTDLSGNPAFRDLLRRVTTVCLEAYDHQGIPFERLVEELQPERSLASTPVFQVMLSYQNVPFPAWEAGSVRVEPVSLEARKAEFDLLLDLFEDGETVWGRLEYSVDIFEEATARRIAGAFQRLLRAVTADPDRRLGDLPMLGEDEHRQVVAWGSGPRREWPEHGLVHECFEERARLAPDAEAVRFEGRTLTYGELDERANRLAHRLRRLGVGPEVLVGVAMDRSPELPVAVLAVLKAGGAYVPIDPDAPWNRLEHVIEDARVPVLLTQREVLEVLPPVEAEALCVEELEEELREESAQAPGTAVTGDDLAHVLHTSGAHGGEPKGRMITHAALRNRLLSMREAYGIGPEDRVLHQTPPSCDAAVWELLLPLTAGAAVVVARPEGHQDARYLVETVRAEAVTTAHLVPSRLSEFLDEPGVEECTGLRRVLCGGEPLPADLQELFFDRCAAELHHVYGDALSWACRRDAGPRPAPVGRPTANTRAHVLDHHRRPVAPGVPGELHIGGPSVPRGYLGRPDLTADRFLPDPLDPAGRLFRTGHRARLREDGAVELLGRADRRVPVRGFRVDLDTVETALAAHEDVREAAVVAREQPAGGLRLVAYVSGEPGLTAADLAAHLKERLPEYMVPAAFAALPSLPRTPHGTLDRALLPELDLGGQTEQRQSYEAPENDLERSIADMWCVLLGAAQVGRHDNFFDLGGHSLLVTKLASRIATGHGVQLPIRELFDHPTVAGLAALVTERQALAPPAAAPVPAVPRDGHLPLSFAQEQLCLHHPVPVEDPYHNVLTALVLEGELDETALRRALDGVVQRHEALRTRIVKTGGEWTQVVDGPGTWPLATADLRDLDDDARARDLRHLVETEGRRPFRIADGPLVRGTLVRTEDDASVLVMVMHHLVTDNWSYGVLVRDLRELYTAHTLGRAPALPGLTVHYPDIAAWQRQRLADGALEEHTAHWRRQLAGLPPDLEFTAPAHQALEPVTGHTLGFRIDAATGKALTELAQRENATLFMVLMAALDVLLATYSGSDDIAVCFPVAGRERPETAELIGYFVNHLVVRGDLTGAPTFRELLGRVRESTLGAYAHQDVPLRLLDGVTTEGRDPFRILFNLLNATVPALDLPGLLASPLDAGIGDAYVFGEVITTMEPREVDLALIMREDGDGLRGMWLYSAERVDPQALAAMTAQWARLLDLVAAGPDTGTAELRRRLRHEILPGDVPTTEVRG
jgi:amino acid adenylation domain-containing protein